MVSEAPVTPTPFPKRNDFTNAASAPRILRVYPFARSSRCVHAGATASGPCVHAGADGKRSYHLPSSLPPRVRHPRLFLRAACVSGAHSASGDAPGPLAGCSGWLAETTPLGALPRRASHATRASLSQQVSACRGTPPVPLGPVASQLCPAAFRLG